jgi:hypothetical protein
MKQFGLFLKYLKNKESFKPDSGISGISAQPFSKDI